MASSVIREIHSLRQMTVGQLREKWLELYGEPTRSRNKDYLWKRLAWRVQELRYGGLSERARARIEELAPDGFMRARTPSTFPLIDDACSSQQPHERPRRRDPRLPSPGSILTRQYHGEEIRVRALDEGFEWQGRQYRSLSAVARAVTGQRWNGLLFFGLTARKRKS